MTAKTKLAGGPDKTVTWIWLDPRVVSSRLNITISVRPHRSFFGNDIPHTVTVTEMDRLFSVVNKDEASIIKWMEGYFKSYFGIKGWLEENGISFMIERESWA